MANNVFTYARGCFVEKVKFPLGTDALLLILLKSTGLQADTTLRNYQTVAAMLASNTEADFTNYARKVISGGVTITTDTTNSKQTITFSNPTWAAAGGAVNNTLGKLVVAYRPTSGSLDSACLPLTYHDFSATTTGSDLLGQVSGSGLALAS